MYNLAYDAVARGGIVPERSEITPYVITIDRNTKYVDYTKMKAMGVIGVMIEGGSLYDVTHTAREYNNPKLNKQIKDAKSNNMLYGLYVDVRARNTQEAELELKQLKLCIRTHPPQLGLWLTLHLTQNKSVNNNIIDTYYRDLVKLGLKDQIGFYVTPQQLNSIDWNKYQNDWYLWINNHLTNITEVEDIVTPAMFVV